MKPMNRPTPSLFITSTSNPSLSTRYRSIARLGASLLVGIVVLCTAGIVRADGGFPSFNQPGNLLISDQFNNRVIEVDQAGVILWQWGLGPNDLSASSILG